MRMQELLARLDAGESIDWTAEVRRQAVAIAAAGEEFVEDMIKRDREAIDEIPTARN